jgi:alkylation response protein AidB-like acyl-CoA dehydrogenase
MYRLTPDQQAIVNRAKEIADKEIAPHAARVDVESVYPQASMDALARAGFMGLTLSPEYGGMGHGMRVMAAVLDEIAQRCASTAMCYKMHLAAAAALAAGVTPPTRQLRAIGQGAHVSTLAWSEFGSRSHFWAPVSREKRDGNGNVVLNASKSFVTSAGQANSYIVSTQWTEAKTATDSMLYMVLREDSGLRVSGPWDALGLRGNVSAPMVLQNVTLPASRALTEPGQGLGMMLNTVLPVFNIGNAAISIGIAEAAIQTTQRHLTTNRFQYIDSSLADLPNERARLAEMRIETDRARAHLAAVIDAVEAPGPATLLMVLESKAAAAETAMQVTDIGLRACGGTGFTKNLGLERHFRDARAAALMGPTSDVIHEFIGRALCGMSVF